MPIAPDWCSARECRSFSPVAPTPCARGWRAARWRCWWRTRGEWGMRIHRDSRLCVLVLNAGSSSLKFCVFRPPAGLQWELAAARSRASDCSPMSAQDGGGDGSQTELGRRCAIGAERSIPSPAGRSPVSARLVLAVGHRVVHGGAHSGPSSSIGGSSRNCTSSIRWRLCINRTTCSPLRWSLNGCQVPQVACFDTSFHRGMRSRQLVPLPRDLRKSGLQRYGFHGLSCEYIASVLPDVAPELAKARDHRASRERCESVCAASGKSIESTMSFTALDGLCMGTRPGALDPGVVLYLFQVLHLAP